jgi:hypothetical protein
MSANTNVPSTNPRRICSCTLKPEDQKLIDRDVCVFSI